MLGVAGNHFTGGRVNGIKFHRLQKCVAGPTLARTMRIAAWTELFAAITEVLLRRARPAFLCCAPLSCNWRGDRRNLWRARGMASGFAANACDRHATRR